MKSNLKFKRVNKNNLKNVLNFLNKFNKKRISINFYVQRYILNFSQSYICKIDDKIIGHVGFVRHTVKKNLFYKKYIFFRHSSLIDKQFRNLKIYKKLCNFAFTKIKKNKNNIGIMTWPNHTNYLRFNSKYQIIFKNNFLTCLNKKKNTVKKKLNIFKLSHIKKIKKIPNISFIEKDEKYLKRKYFYSHDKNKYFINILFKNNSESISIFDLDNINLRILEYFGKERHYIDHINDLLCYRKKILFFHKLTKYRNKFEIQKKFQTIAYIFQPKIKKILLQQKALLVLGDTDSFINYEKIK